MFFLSKELFGHEQDVKSVISHKDKIFSASRDSTVREWDGTSNSTTEIYQYRLHEGYVNSISYHNQYIVSGGQDAIIHLVKPGESNAEYSLVGHTANVCALHCDQSSIVSGSWDGTAKLWREGKCINTMEGHQGAVWAVLCTEHGVLTGGADRTIRLWKDDRQTKNYPAGKDCIRALALHPLGFVSAGNDSIIRIHSFEGEMLHELEGHESFIYSVAVSDNGDIYSVGEDKTLRIWKDGRLDQTIIHPAVSVWAVTLLANGDVVTGSSDAVVRVFTSSEERKASAEEIATYEKSAAVAAIPAQSSNIPNNLPGLEALAGPGKKEGEIKMIRTSPDLVEAHQWSGGVWTKVGEVVGASAQKVKYEGKEWDFVFDVDIAEGSPPLKLPYNTHENPYEAANRFIAKYELDVGFQAQIVKFIETNTGGIPLGVPKETPNTTEEQPATTLTPQRQALAMTAGNAAPIKKKMIEFASSLSDSRSTTLDSIDVAHPSAAQITTLLDVITSWPREKRFPCMDLLRLCIVNAPNDGIDLKHCLDVMLTAGEFTSTNDKVRETNMMLSLRFIANCCARRPGDSVLQSNAEDIANALSNVKIYTNRNLSLALSTCLLNCAVVAHSSSSAIDGINLIEAIVSLLRSIEDAEIQFRTLIALGTILHISDDAVEAARDVFEAPAALQAMTPSEDRVKIAREEVQALLRR